jgi:hypothetical protein
LPLPTENTSEDLTFMKDRIPFLEKQIDKDWRKWLVKLWIICVICVNGFGALGLVISYSVTSYFSLSNTTTLLVNNYELINSMDPSQVSSVVLAPTITIIGLIVGFMPVLSFFYITDLKENQRELRAKRIHFKRTLIRKDLANKNNLELVEKYFEYRRTVISNKIVGILSFVSIFVISSLAILVGIILSYSVFNGEVSLMIDIAMIFSVATGVMLILQMMRNKPLFRFRKYVIRPPKVIKKLEEYY